MIHLLDGLFVEFGFGLTHSVLGSHTVGYDKLEKSKKKVAVTDMIKSFINEFS